MRNRKLQGFAAPAHKKISTLPLPAAHPPGSIFLWQPLHLSIRSRVAALCLNISFVSASVAGGCRSVLGLAFVHSCLLSVPLATKRFSSGSCGLSVQFQSSLFRGGSFYEFRDVYRGILSNIMFAFAVNSTTHRTMQILPSMK
jgi:hypothetical protein